MLAIPHRRSAFGSMPENSRTKGRSAIRSWKLCMLIPKILKLSTASTSVGMSAGGRMLVCHAMRVFCERIQFGRSYAEQWLLSASDVVYVLYPRDLARRSCSDGIWVKNRSCCSWDYSIIQSALFKTKLRHSRSSFLRSSSRTEPESKPCLGDQFSTIVQGKKKRSSTYTT